jgi:hypothetical protein
MRGLDQPSMDQPPRKDLPTRIFILVRLFGLVLTYCYTSIYTFVVELRVKFM